MEGARRNEEDMVGIDHPVFRVDGGSLHDRQEVPLHPFARDVRTGHLPPTSRDLVDLIDEDDA